MILHLDEAAPEGDGAPKNEIMITEAMIEAGEQILLGELGGAVSSHWSARDLAMKVYAAMVSLDSPNEHRSRTRTVRG